jgi:D-aminopeptidase
MQRSYGFSPRLMRQTARPRGRRAKPPGLRALTCLLSLVCVATAFPCASASSQEGADRPRAREVGITPGILAPGPLNAITDVEGVRVGHTTLIEGQDIRTGVTAILPHAGNLFQEKVPAAIFVGNGFGKLAGISQVQELGTLETPILLTGTLSVPRVADALITYMLALPGNEEVRSINPVVGETNDGGLSDIRARPIRPEHVFAAIRGAQTGAVAEGNVGAGTGTRAFGFKGGIGTSSRRIPAERGGWTVGVLVQTNYGGVLNIAGIPVEAELRIRESRAMPAPNSTLQPTATADITSTPTATVNATSAGISDTTPPDPGDGSCMIVVATDAPLTHRNLERLAMRALMGMARTGSSFSNGSGDYVIAFSTHVSLRGTGVTHPVGEAGGASAFPLTPAQASPLFLAVIEATEEAIYNSLFAATSMEGYEGRRVEALPIAEVVEILEAHAVIR